MDQVRSFVAIELPEGLKAELSGLREHLSSDKYTGVRWVDPQSIHLTLKFLGDVAVGRIDDITAALTEAAREIAPFRLAISKPGVFPNPNRPRVAWVGLSGDTGMLKQLQQRVESCLEGIGFARESRSFSPHLTIARVRDQTPPEERQRFGKVITGTEFKSQYYIDVESIYLMRSQLTRQGAIYSRLSEIPLNKRKEV